MWHAAARRGLQALPRPPIRAIREIRGLNFGSRVQGCCWGFRLLRLHPMERVAGAGAAGTTFSFSLFHVVGYAGRVITEKNRI